MKKILHFDYAIDKENLRQIIVGVLPGHHQRPENCYKTNHISWFMHHFLPVLQIGTVLFRSETVFP